VNKNSPKTDNDAKFHFSSTFAHRKPGETIARLTQHPIMLDKQKIRFIANPLSGTGNCRHLGEKIEQYLDHDRFDYELCYTQYAGHAIELAKEAAALDCTMIVACGGDGTVNEVASVLIGTDTVLGILPCGSGNGFATHLGVGRDVVKAIGHLNTGKVLTIDSCKMNNRHFVNLAGVGFDAEVAKLIKGSTKRGFWGYFKLTVRAAWQYEQKAYEIEVDGVKMNEECLLVEIANAPIYGYGFSIVPPAKLNDGKLEVLIAKKAPKWRYILEAWRFLNHSFHKSNLVVCATGKNVVVTPSKPSAVHLDGEGLDLEAPARFSIAPASLKVICPKIYFDLLASKKKKAFGN
jgi:YegS/Rv2252/BmrU family lipid kinase